MPPLLGIAFEQASDGLITLQRRAGATPGFHRRVVALRTQAFAFDDAAQRAAIMLNQLLNIFRKRLRSCVRFCCVAAETPAFVVIL